MSSSLIVTFREQNGALCPTLVEGHTMLARGGKIVVENQNDFQISVGAKFSAEVIDVTGRQINQVAKLRLVRPILAIEMESLPDFWVDGHMMTSLLTDLRLGHHVLLVGPKGTGKTTFCRRVAKECIATYHKIDCSGLYKPMDLVGSNRAEKGTMQFVPTELVRVLREAKDRNGCPTTIINLDELSRIRGNGESLHPMLDDERALSVTTSEGSYTIEVPKGVVFMATANPVGGAYVGTGKLDAALRDRFEMYSIGYPPAEFESRMLMTRTGVKELEAMQIVKIANELRKQALAGMFPEGGGPSPRRTLRAAAFVANGISVTEAIQWKILNQYEGDQDEEASERMLAYATARAIGITPSPRVRDVMHLNGGK